MSDTPIHPAPVPEPKAATAPETDQQPVRPSRRVPVWFRVLLGLVCYVLSIGPMFWTWHYAEHFNGNPLIRVFYVPLRLLCSIPIVEYFINRYIEWWIS